MNIELRPNGHKVTWEDIMEKVAHDDMGKTDVMVHSSLMEAVDERVGTDHTLKLRISDDEPRVLHGLTPFALAQLSERLDIPSEYLERIPVDMQVTDLNYDLWRLANSTDARKSHAFFIRLKNGHIRACLTSRYQALDNKALLDLISVLPNMEDYSISWFYLDDGRLWGEIINDKTFRFDGDDIIKMGVRFGNSEVGLRSITIKPVIYRITTHGKHNTILVHAKDVYQHPHTGSKELMLQKINDAMAVCETVAKQGVDSYIKSREEIVEQPREIIEAIAKRQRITKKFLNVIHAMYDFEPGLNKYAVINAFTRAAQSLSGDKRVEMEALAGRILVSKLPSRIVDMSEPETDVLTPAPKRASRVVTV